jgi:dTDP-glucose 4,6-dehydratase
MMNENNRSYRQPGSILVTGGSGFIGCNFIHYLFNQDNFKGNVINVDKLTYAGNPESLASIDAAHGPNGDGRYSFFHCDICDFQLMEEIIDSHNIDTIVHFAAESHVDRSIHGPKDFVQTNIMGTFTLLEITRKLWLDSKKEKKENVLFHHVSTDEVFGSLGDTGYFYEDTSYDPRSPYSASKASSDHLVNAYHHTYNLPITMSNCSNNYGPYQFPEKLIPLMILNTMEGKPLPIYGDGMNVRDWLYVEDHCSAIYAIITKGSIGETYNVGGENELPNIDVVNRICQSMDSLYPISSNPTLPSNKLNHYKDLITFVKDRPGHDHRYAINCDKIKNNLNWKPSVTFPSGLTKTIQWYLDNPQWINNIRTGQYKSWLQKNYDSR